MNPAFSSHLPQKWSEAHRRAETYLRALRGGFGSDERQLLARAVGVAREQHRQQIETHPVTLVMETLFDLLPTADAMPLLALAPSIHRTTMLPEPMEFPVHNWLRRISRWPKLTFAGPN